MNKLLVPNIPELCFPTLRSALGATQELEGCATEPAFVSEPSDGKRFRSGAIIWYWLFSLTGEPRFPIPCITRHPIYDCDAQPWSQCRQRPGETCHSVDNSCCALSLQYPSILLRLA